MNIPRLRANDRRGFTTLRTILSVIGLLVVFSWTVGGCGPRAEVVKEKVLKQIDALIGESEIKQKEVEAGIANWEKALQPLVEGKIKAKVEVGQLDRKIAEIEQKVADATASLKTLQGYISSDKPVELAGKTYSKDELNSQAKKVIEAHKTLSGELATMKQTRAKLEQRATMLEERHNDAKQKLVLLKTQVKQIDTNIASLNALKEARQAAGDGDATLGENFEKLQAQINGLDADIQTQLGMEDEKWKEVSAAADVDDVAKFINATKGAEDTLAEIDKILGSDQ